MSCRRRHHRWSSRWRRPRPSLSERRLFRDPAHGRIAGVCAGLAAYFRIGRTMMRFIAVTGLIFAPEIVVLAYLLAALLLPTREELDDIDAERPFDPGADPGIGTERSRAQAFDAQMQAAEHPDLDTQRRSARQARERLHRIDQRLRTLEAYVTSRRFELNREFGKL